MLSKLALRVLPRCLPNYPNSESRVVHQSIDILKLSPVSARFLSNYENGHMKNTSLGLTAQRLMSTTQNIPKSDEAADQENKLTEKTPDAPESFRKPMPKSQKYGFWFFGFSLVAGSCIFFYHYGKPEYDENGKVIYDQFHRHSWSYWHRFRANTVGLKKDILNTEITKILPDPLKPPFIQPKYTICVELTGLLVHADWTHKHGWRFQKRPGLNMFLSQIAYPEFELVVYTVENFMTFDPVVCQMDPEQQIINYRVYSDALKFSGNRYVKDISTLNRDPGKTIIIDWDKEAVPLALENSLILPKWEGDTRDTSLVALAQLLQTIKQTDVDDVREVMSYYRQFDDPIGVFRENQRKLQQEMAALEEKQKEVQSKPSLMSGFSFMRRK